MKHLQRSEGITSCYLQYHLFLPGGMKQNKWPMLLINGYNFNFSKCECQIHPLCQIDMSSDLAHLPMDGTLQKHVGAFKGLNVTVQILSSIQCILAFCHTLTLKVTDKLSICAAHSSLCLLPKKTTNNFMNLSSNLPYLSTHDCIQTWNRTRELVVLFLLLLRLDLCCQFQSVLVNIHIELSLSETIYAS